MEEFEAGLKHLGFYFWDLQPVFVSRSGGKQELGKEPRIMNTRPSGHPRVTVCRVPILKLLQWTRSSAPHDIPTMHCLSMSLTVSAAAWEITHVPGVLIMILLLLLVLKTGSLSWKDAAVFTLLTHICLKAQICVKYWRFNLQHFSWLVTYHHQQLKKSHF